MFYLCTELIYIDFNNFSFENTKDVSCIFNYCKKLETVIKSNNDESFMEMIEMQNH